MKKAKELIAKAIEKEMGFPVFGVEYDRSKLSVLMRVWRDEWYLCGHAFTEGDARICFYSSCGIRQILKGCRAVYSKRDDAIQIYPA